MNMDCQWIDKKLEAFFSGTLSHEDQQRAQHHLENCGSCGKEVAALNSIDPLVKQHFQSEMRRYRQASPRRVAKGRLVAVSSVALLAVCVLLAVTLRTSQPDANAPAVIALESGDSSPRPADIAPLPKSPERPATVERAKPVDSTPATAVQTLRPAAAPNVNAPDFMVMDPAGYSRTLGDYRGYVFLVGILRTGQADATSDFEHLYKQFSSNRKFRFLAVSNDRQIRLANTTFPLAYNQGSKLFGAEPGDFLLFDETGAIQLRGSLVKDLDKLQKTLQNAG